MLGQLAEPYEVIVRFTYRASRSRAMPETEKPPAMPEDIYFKNRQFIVKKLYICYLNIIRGDDYEREETKFYN